MISESFSEIYRTVQECCPVKNSILDHSDILVNATDIKERKKKWKLAFCKAQECVNALDYMLENGLETLLNTQEKLRVEEGLSEKEKELNIKQNELDSTLNELEEGLRKAIESILFEIKELSEECRNLEKEFTKKASNIPNIIENMNKSDTKFDSEYLDKKVTVEDIQILQNTRKQLLEELEQLRKDEEALNKEIQNLEIKWNAYRKRTQRLETEISLKKTETSHQAIQVDAHINRRLSTCKSIFSDKENYQNIKEGDTLQEQMGTRKKRRDSVVKWIGRLSMNSPSEDQTDQLCDHESVTMNLKEGAHTDNSGNNSHIIEDRDEEVQGELQVLNLLSLVKIEKPESDEAQTLKTEPPSSTLKLKVDPSPLLSKFLDPNFVYCSNLEPINIDKENCTKANQSYNGLFSKGALDFSLKLRNQCDGSKSLEEISLCSQSQNAPEKSLNNEDIALFNIFVGELQRNENIPVSSIGKLLCSTLK
ncbi:CTCL tumor antigen se2-1 [Cryptosporidium sp. chipmunk genotype I]|uniref:CTCL tumor antigen se2-1 n=1 Tax=Cryptosporidium sp. chipmunk genotype I TaxID=1280935 RepID=UPI00351A1F65|nr:CTCL tumor antigen se2-1 [Cryptosporidium sp. chipmunk genotype I]